MSTFTPSELAQLKIIENEVDSYLRSKQTNPQHAVGINSALSRVVPNTLLPSKKVTILWNDHARTPFIMSITPDISELHDKAEELNAIMTNPKSSNIDFVRKWAEIKQWYIEIDTRVLDKKSKLCVTDGQQFVALLCHEVGHVMTESPMRLISNYKIQSLNFSMTEKLMLSGSKFVRTVMLPMYTHTLQFFIVVNNRTNQKACEMAADAYVPDAYKGAMVSYMNNHLLSNPEGSRLVVDESSFDNEQNMGIQLSKESIEMLKGRRDELNRQIQSQYNSPSNGPFHKRLMKFIGQKLTGYDPESDKYTTSTAKSMMEASFMREYERISKDAMKATMEAARIGERDIDVLSIQVDDIHTPEDKMYMIHKVYDYIEAVGAENAKLAKSQTNKFVANKMEDDRLDRLNEIRARILRKDVSSTGDKYGLFIKYPAGYEG